VQLLEQSLQLLMGFIHGNLIDFTGNLFTTTNRTLTIDTVNPGVTYGANTAADNTNASRDWIFVNTSINETNTANITFKLFNSTGQYNSTSYNLANSSVNNTINWTSLAEGTYTYNSTVVDLASNSNSTSTRTITLDRSPPNVTSVSYSPSDSGGIDPGVNVTINATVVDTRLAISTVILQYYNSSTSANLTMTQFGSSSVYQANLTTATTNKNYTFNIFANDSVGNANISTNNTIRSEWDCTWNTSVAGLGGSSAFGYYENKKIGNITLQNTGDSNYSTNNCTITFTTSNFDNFTNAYYLLDSLKWSSSDRGLILPSSVVVSAGTNSTYNVNASFPAEKMTERPYLIINSSLNDTRDGKYGEIIGINMTISPPGPYLIQQSVTIPTVYLTDAINFNFSAYVQNIAGNGSDINTAHNVSFNWTVPSYFTLISGNQTQSYSNITNDSLYYNNITFGLTGFSSLSPGNTNATIYSFGYNSSGNLISDASNTTILNNLVNITLACYDVSDSTCVSACINESAGLVYDPDCSLSGTTTTTTTTTSSGGGGGPSAGGGGSVETKVDYSIVRGKQNDIHILFKNNNLNYSLTDLKFSVSGEIAKYIIVQPASIISLGPNAQTNINLNIVSPTYLKLGLQKLILHITGIRDGEIYREDRTINLLVTDITKEEAERLLQESKDLIGKLREQNLSSDYLNGLLSAEEKALQDTRYEIIVDNAGIIKKQVNFGLEANSAIIELQSLILQANEKGINTKGSSRLLKLALLSLNRGDYEEAYSRAREAQNTYALEVKGEIGKFSYYLKNNPKEISLAGLFLIIFGFASYRVGRLQNIRRKIRKNKEEEMIINQLMKLAQEETFIKKRMEMSEYNETIDHYEKKLAHVVEELIDLENEETYALTFISKGKRWGIERNRIIDLIKKLQEDYLKRGIIQTKVYELKMQSYEKRIGEIDSQIAEQEAKEALKKVSGFKLNLFKK